MMNTNDNVLPFTPRPKLARKPYVGPLQAERERCAEVFQSPFAQGAWADAARRLIFETSYPATYVIVLLKEWSDEVDAEIKADMAAGRALD